MKEKCAVFGVFTKDLEASRLTYFGLYALQHRGQESSGIVSSDGKKFFIHKAMGLVAQVYNEEVLSDLKGHIAIGHNRYSTSGGSVSNHIQPSGDKNSEVFIAHNGNISDLLKLDAFLISKKIDIYGLNDTEKIQALIQYFISNGDSLEDAVENSFPLLTGAFCLLILTKDKLVAVRDSYGIRPFCFGKINSSGYAFASESCALDTINAAYIRDIAPGEMIVVDKNGYSSKKLADPHPNLDIFEFIYFARPDSMLYGKRVHEVRKNLGRILARETKIKADVVIPVPDSAIPAAVGFSEASKIPFDFGLVKNRYIGRTFIMPDQRLRDKGVQMKLNPIKEIIFNKRIIVIDDSIVRGTTSKKLVTMLRANGAREVHLMSSCPPVRYPDFYGIDTPSQKDLIASQVPEDQINNFIKADSLSFLSYDGMIEATGLPEDKFCTSCFTGKYPISIGENQKNIKKIK